MSILYSPADGVAADFIPFFWKGDYHLFYLKDYRDVPGHGEGTPWWHLVTRDFVHFQDWGEALARGPEGSQDVWVFTGSAIERSGTFHIFYTGHNGHFEKTERPVQGVMHATSADLRSWTKDAGFLFFAPTERFEKDDWRDPFVFWNAEAEEYWMLLAARRRGGPSRQRGCTALATSKDLRTWSVREPFWSPDEYYTHECPDLFRLGDWWYLVYSTFSERCVTHYRMSRDLRGPWLAPANDTFDGRAYYAAKTAGDNGQRLVFGWLPTREGERDDGGWQWGGNLVVHQLEQQPDGALTVHAPLTVLAAFASPVELAPRAVLGQWTADRGGAATSAVSRCAAMTLGAMPDECLVEAAISFNRGTAACGLLLRADEALERYYQVRLEPARQRMVVDRWPRPGDQPYLLERSLAMQPGQPVVLRAIVDGTCLVVYANEQVALSCRMYAHRSGHLGLFVAEGEARFDKLALRVRA
jgi:beta-fructofuranosidase